MFDSFFCDQLNGLDCYDYDYDGCFDGYESNRQSQLSGSPSRQWIKKARQINAVKKTYTIYGRLIRETPKAALYRLVKQDCGKYSFGEEKWIPKSCYNCSHISEFDQNDESFKDEFKVTGIDDIYLINIPDWLFHKMFKEPKKQVVFSWEIN